MGDAPSIPVEELIRYQRDIQRTNKQLIPEARTLTAEILSNAIGSSPKLQDKRWVSTQLQLVADQEFKLKLLEILGENEDAFYQIGLISGGAAAMAGLLFGAMIPALEDKIPGLALGAAENAIWLIPAGLTFSGYCAIMLGVPRVFGRNGIQFEAEASYFGLAGGSIKLG